MNTRVLFKSTNGCDYATPLSVYQQLDIEFKFDDDPCPLGMAGLPLLDGLRREWGQCVFLNPPYGRVIGQWIEKAYRQASQGRLVVCLIPSRTDTRWWHEWVMKASEIRFIRGRLKFNGAPYNAPFPSAIVIFDGRQHNQSMENDARAGGGENDKGTPA
jgi:hypothetical protein